MKGNLKYLIVGVAAVAGLTSCKKQLDKFPPNAIELSQSFKTVKDAKTWNTGAYAQLRARVYGLYQFSQDVQGDQVNASLDFGNRNGNPHRWTGFLSDDYTIRDVWAAYYNAITNANLAIAGFENITPANGTETTELNRYKGDARFFRAFYYLELILRWGKPYEPASANTDLGVPIVTTYDPNARPARATVKAVYDLILADLAQAKTLLSAVNGAQGSTKITKHAVAALEARVKLYMQDWAGAKAAADEVISSNTYPLYTTQADITNYWAVDLTRETILSAYVLKPNEMPNTNGLYLGYNPALNKFTPDFIPSQWVVDFYPAGDYRKAAYFAQKAVFIQGTDYPNTWLINKYPGNPAHFTTANTNYAHTPKILRVAELYLISAEAAARLGGANEAAALTTLNALRVARNLPALVGTTGAALIQAIKDERFRELAFEGFRLWDLKRWHEGFTRNTPQNTAMLNTGSQYTTLSIAPNHDKFVWGLPTNDMTTNPNLAPQNPGW